MTEKMREKRKKLRKISDTAKKIHKEIQAENITTVNDMIMRYIYNPTNKLIFNTFWGWKKEGFTVKKGSKAYVLWGQPLNTGKGKEQGKPKQAEQETEDENDFFPLAYIFSSEQVRKVKLQKAEN